MLSKGWKREIEIKLRLDSAEQGRRLLRRAGFRVIRRRVHEDNAVLDRSGGSLRKQGLLLRLRRAGRGCILTFKGPPARGKYKSRQEVETAISDFAGCEAILHGLGFRRVFHYEKYRTQYQGSTGGGVVMLDETPIGVFLELEGEPAWIGQTAKLLGFSESHYITTSYVGLYEAHCRRQGRRPRDMVFAIPMPPFGIVNSCKRESSKIARNVANRA